MEKNEKSLVTRWIDICNEYLKQFCEKHELEYDPSAWVGSGDGGTGTVICINETYFVSMEDIRYDIDHNVPAEKFFEYYEYDDRLRGIELSYDLLYNPNREVGRMVHVNYRSFCRNCPLPYSYEKLAELEADMEAQKKKVEEFQKELKSLRGQKS